MTCIAAIAQNGTVYMGGDSAGVSDRHYLAIHKAPKVFQNGPYLIGYTSSFRMGQLLQYSELPQPNDDDLTKFMVTTFVDRVRDIMKTGGVLKAENQVEELGNFLVGVEGRLFEHDDDFGIHESEYGYNAVGSGISCALASMYSTVGGEPKTRILVALQSAQQFTTSVREPFHIYEGLK